MKVSILIPAYNEEGGIAPTIDELEQTIDNSQYEIIIVNDGSKDNTGQILKELSEKYSNVIAKNHKKNRGYGSAIKTALSVATGDYVVWYDADGQHRPEDMLKLVDAMEQNDWDYCIGIRDSASHVEKSRKLGKKVLGWIVDFLAREPMNDFNSGMRGFKREILIKYRNFLPKRFGASTVTSFLMQEVGVYLGGEVSINVRQRVGTSSVRQFRDGFRTIALILNIIIVFRPLQIFSTLGVFFIILGIVYGAYGAIRDGLGVPVMASVFCIMGVQMFFYGILSYQISRLKLDVCEYFERDK